MKGLQEVIAGIGFMIFGCLMMTDEPANLIRSNIGLYGWKYFFVFALFILMGFILTIIGLTNKN